MPTAYVPTMPPPDLWQGEVEDISVNWIDRMRFSANGAGSAGAYGVSATGGNGSGWSAIGESASAYTFYVPLGLSALASSLVQMWSSVVTASANGANVTSSALTGVLTNVRLSATGAVGAYPVSARLRTTSGRELREVWTANIVG